MSTTTATAPRAEDTTGGRAQLIAAGVLSAALFAVGYLLSGFIPGGGATEASTVATFYAEGGTGSAYALFFGLLAATGCLIWFFTLLGARLGDTTPTRVGMRLATVGAALLVAGGAIMLAPTSALKISGAEFVGVPTAVAFAQAGLGVMVIGGIWMLAASVIVLSWRARRVSDYPQWLAWSGIVIGTLSLGSLIWAPGLLLAVWFLLAAIGLGRSRTL